MESPGLLSILVLCVLLLTTRGSGLRDMMIPRKCPRFRGKCEFREVNECTRNSQCQDRKKCCLFNCKKRCLDIEQDICSLPKQPGPCMAYFHRWWYDKENNTCSKFIYGGCRGNNNNFQSRYLCRSACP